MKVQRVSQQEARQFVILRKPFNAGNVKGMWVYDYSSMPVRAHEGDLADGLKQAVANGAVYVVTSYDVPVGFATLDGEVRITETKWSQSTTQHTHLAAYLGH